MDSDITKVKKIFLSHIHEEGEVAKILKDWIVDTYSQNVEVFVSSDPDDNPAGTRWLDKIEVELQELNLLIILCSAMSVGRPWINFEAGASWIKKVPIIPFCYFGMQKDLLPRPLSDLQAIDFNGTKALERLMKAIATHLKLIQPPKLDYNKMKVEIETAIGAFSMPLENPKNQVFKVKSENELESERKKEISNKSGRLNQEEKKILIVFGRENRALKSEFLSQELQIHDVKVQVHLTNLVKKKYLYDNPNYLYGTSYSLNEKGKVYLVKNDLLG